MVSTSTLKCSKDIKFCHPKSLTKAGDDFICCGITKKPTKYKKDVVKLCLKGKFVPKFTIEMTVEEAICFIKSLSTAISF